MEVLDDLQAALAGRYQILRELGRGGMAVVYLARDIKHERDVAIKVLPPELANAMSAERFVREIRTAAQLAHPNILPLHDSIAVGTLRCYVMPYVEGESLRQRLDRERQLGIEQAVDIVRQLAAGLDYAHAHGVVHRDVKPENILLVGDEALIADFGLARALDAASSTPFTESGVAVGTPAYMSPEQAAAEPVDGRTDLYALACVFFEMVAGLPPFRGATVQALMAAHASRVPPSLCEERDSCPPAMDAAVRRALAKVPADRFRTAGEFAHALQRARVVTRPALRAHKGQPWLAWGSAALALTAAAALGPVLLARARLAGIALDSTAVAVLPFTGAGGQELTSTLARERLISAFAGWNGLRVADLADTARSGSDARSLARRSGAGRYVEGTVVSLGDSVELRATLHDTGTAPVRQAAVRVADDRAGGSAAYRLLSARLLRSADGDDNADREDSAPGTRHAGAWRAYTRGQAARMRWALEDAEAAFRDAVHLDPAFGRAHLWLAQVELWQRPIGRKEWAEEAARATALIGTLGSRDSMLALGLAALADSRYPESCAAYRAMHAAMPESDLPWYGLGHCLALDPVVVPSTRTPSGWQFRGDPVRAASAFDSALVHGQGAPAFAFRMLGRLLIAVPNVTRFGVAAPPDKRTFHAFPELVGDSVAYVPYLAGSVESGAHTASATRSAALQRNLTHLDAAYHEWVRRDTQSVDAWQALAFVQELQGEDVALASAQQARSRSEDETSRLTLGAVMVRLMIKQDRFASARALADSLLRAVPAPDGPQAVTLSGLAALLGRIDPLSRLLVTANQEDPEIVFRSTYSPPAPVLSAAARLFAAAAVGACTDSLAAASETMDRLLAQYAPAEQRGELRGAALVRPMSLAVPCLGAGPLASMPSGDRLVRMQRQLGTGDRRGVRANFDTLRAKREGMRPGDVALDHLFQEAWLLLQLGDTAEATRYLDLPLGALPTLSTRLLDDAPAAAALGRAIALRADLAAAAHDPVTARQYATRVVTLWSGASPPLQPLVRRMRVLAAGSVPTTQ